MTTIGVLAHLEIVPNNNRKALELCIIDEELYMAEANISLKMQTSLGLGISKNRT